MTTLPRLKNIKFFIQTFGCQMNENDSEHIGGILAGMGAEKASSLEESNLIIINTCAVREKSEEKLYSYLGRLTRLKRRKEVLVGVVGCVAQLHGAELLEKKGGVDFILGPDNYDQLPRFLMENQAEKFISTAWSGQWKEHPAELTLRDSSISAYVSIMEGCNNFCAYCIVPFTRGREKYRPANHILAEAAGLAEKGYKEVQLLGQNVTTYKDPDTGLDFSRLLRQVGRLDGIEWIRFITSHPKNFTLDIGLAMEETPQVCRQLHLPVQAGSSSVLKRMNRGYTKEEYLEKVDQLRRLMPEISLSTDIIVGFPGETEDEFQETLDLLERVRFANIFSFRYSPRPRTKASQLRDDVPFNVKKRRLMEVQGLQKRIQLEAHQTAVGRTMKVLGTGKSRKNSGIFSGRNEAHQVVNFRYPAPEKEPGDKSPVGKFVNVVITGCGPYSLHGECRELR